MRLFWTMCLTLGLSVSVAQADLIDPDEASCRSKTAGAACTMGGGQKGTCRPDQCCRNDYSEGVPPKSVCSDCLTCKAGTAKPAPVKPDSVKPAPATPAPATPVEPMPMKPTPIKPMPAKEKAATDPPTPKPAAGGCAAASSATGPWGIGALSIGLLLALGLGRTRRRRH